MKGRLALLAILGGTTGKARRGRPLPRVNGMGEKGTSRGKALIKPGSMWFPPGGGKRRGRERSHAVLFFSLRCHNPPLTLPLLYLLTSFSYPAVSFAPFPASHKAREVVFFICSNKRGCEISCCYLSGFSFLFFLLDGLSQRICEDSFLAKIKCCFSSRKTKIFG